VLAVLAAALLALLVVLYVAQTARAAEEPEFEGQVVGGRAVPNGKYPFVAALLDTRNGGSAYRQQFCGGTLIDRNSVLTAAHCVDGVPARYLRVAVGRTVLNSRQGTLRRVSRVFVHPGYAPDRNMGYDAAVLKLNKAVKGTRPVRLAGGNQDFLEKPGRRATVAGWGNTTVQPPDGSNATDYPNRMREASVPLVSDRRANNVYKSEYQPRIMVATYAARKGVCWGDSGGPLLSRTGGAYRQSGIVSFGAGCGARGYPQVYTEVNAYANKRFISGAARR
jgi:secreted trypsin-like serine protease